MAAPRRTLAVLAALAWGLGPWLLARAPAAVELAPVLAVLRGPLGVALLVLSMAAALAHVLPPPRAASPPPALLLGTSWVVLAAIGLFYTSRLRVSGDEPHYLLMAQSLWREGDLDLRDNYAREDWRETTPGPLVPHYGAPRADGRPFPAHPPGLPLILAPVYGLAGRAGCVVLMSLIAAALAIQVRALALDFTGSEGAALVAWAAALSPPVLFYAFHVYTEVPSALALAVGLRILLSGPGPAASVGAALAASALPWLHVKMIPGAVALGVVALVRLRGRARATFVIVAAAMTAAYLGFYQGVFGRPTPLAVYGGVPADVAIAPLRALAGLFMDRSFGLLPHAPVYLIALFGLPVLVRRGRRAWPHLLVGAAAIAPGLLWRMWWGGQCPPARLLVPVVPLLAVAIAARCAGRSRGIARWRRALLAMGFALALFMVARPGELLLLNRGDRPTRVWTALSAAAPVERYLPSLVAASAEEWRVTALWLLAIGVLLGLDRLALRSDAVDRLFRGLGLPLVLVLAVGIGVDAWARAG